MLNKRTLAGALGAVAAMGCAKTLPQPLASYPEAVHIVDLGKDKTPPDEARAFGWPAVREAEGKFARDLTVGTGDNVRKVDIECAYVLKEGACPSVDLRCKVTDGGSFEMSLTRGGELSLGKPDTAKEATLLVDMNDEEREGKALRSEGSTHLDLLTLAPAGKKTTWGAQLVDGRVDDTSGTWTAQRLDTEDFKFNLLLASMDTAYVSVHQLHPSYERTFAILATAGSLWAENRASFSPCSP